MIKIFDYLFYRIYMHNFKHKKVGLLAGSLFVGFSAMSLLTPIWYNIIYVITKDYSHIRVYTYFVSFLFLVWSYWKCKKRKEYILKKYSNSTYNKIPIIFIYCTFILISIIGIILGIISKKIMGTD